MINVPIGMARSRKVLYYLLTAIVSASCVLAIDVLMGRFDDLFSAREDSLNFRSEAAPLSLHTKNLVPNLIHKYDNIIWRKEGDDLRIDNPRFFRTDQYGIIRGSEKKGEYRFTILFLGGSTTECNEVDEQFRFPARVETLLVDQYHLNVRTWNSGVRGHTTIDSINLIDHPTYKKADFVMLMHNINDRLRLAVQGSYEASIYSPPPLSFERVTASAARLALDIWDFISYRSNILFTVRTRLNKVNPYVGEPTNPVLTEKAIEFDDKYFASNLKNFRSTIEIFIALVRAQKQTPVIMTQPLGKPSQSQSAFNEEIRQIASENKVLLIDLDRALPSERQTFFFSDSIHFNNDGSTFVANVIARHLARQLEYKDGH